jgi:hypothetical protein
MQMILLFVFIALAACQTTCSTGITNQVVGWVFSGSSTNTAAQTCNTFYSNTVLSAASSPALPSGFSSGAGEQCNQHLLAMLQLQRTDPLRRRMDRVHQLTAFDCHLEQRRAPSQPRSRPLRVGLESLWPQLSFGELFQARPIVSLAPRAVAVGPSSKRFPTQLGSDLGPWSSTIVDSPPLVASYLYGLHIKDTAGIMVTETQSGLQVVSWLRCLAHRCVRRQSPGIGIELRTVRHWSNRRWPKEVFQFELRTRGLAWICIGRHNAR